MISNSVTAIVNKITDMESKQMHFLGEERKREDERQRREYEQERQLRMEERQFQEQMLLSFGHMMRGLFAQPATVTPPQPDTDPSYGQSMSGLLHDAFDVLHEN